MSTEQMIKVTVPDAPIVGPTSVPVAGFKSTEFISMLVTGVTLAAGAIPQQYAPVVAGLVGLYVACRTLLKAVHVLGYARQLPDLPDITPSTTKESP